jgi:hypothetical protein
MAVMIQTGRSTGMLDASRRFGILWCAVLALSLPFGCSDSDDDGPSGPTEGELVARETEASDTVFFFLDSFLDDPVGEPNPDFLVPDFNYERLDRTEYLLSFWVADDAFEIPDGVQLLFLQPNGSTLNDYIVTGSLAPDLFNPVLTEMFIEGDTEDGGQVVSFNQSFLSFFSIEDGDAMRVLGEGPLWEYTQLLSPPQGFQYVTAILELQLGGGRARVFEGFPEPFFPTISSVAVLPGDVIDVDALLGVDGTAPLGAAVNVRVTVRLFIGGTRADAGYTVPGQTLVQRVFVLTGLIDQGTTATVRVPQNLPIGLYALTVLVENSISPDFANDTYATDLVQFPVEVF